MLCHGMLLFSLPWQCRSARSEDPLVAWNTGSAPTRSDAIVSLPFDFPASCGLGKLEFVVGFDVRFI